MAASSYIIGGIEGRRLTERHTTPEYTPGQLASTTGKLYKYCQYNEGAGSVAGAAGGVAYYYNGGSGSASNYANAVVTHDLSDSDEVGAGVLQASLATGEYGWMQVKGQATLAIDVTAGSPGDALTASGAGDGTLDAADPAANQVICAALLDDTASANVIICDFVQ